MEYTIDFFIKKFEAIPDANWTTGVYKDFCGNKCAIGHCLSDNAIYKAYNNNRGRYKPTAQESETEFKQAKCLGLLFNDVAGKGVDIVYGINNGYDSRYRQSTPKKRILAALYDIKKLQEQPKEKIRTVYVSVPTSITKQSAELIVNTN